MFSGQELRGVEYTAEENATWSAVYRNLQTLYATYAVREQREGLRLLVESGVYRPDRVPHLPQISQFLHGSISSIYVHIRS